MKNHKKMILNIAAIFIGIILVGTLSTTIYAKIKWNVQFNEYKNRTVAQAKGNLDEVRESDYAEILNMDYLTQDGISIKTNSLLMTDDCFDANITFKFPEKTDVNSQTFGFGYAVYDEKNNIYVVRTRIHVGSKEKYDNITPFIYKELGVKYNKKNIYGIQLMSNCSEELVEVNEQERTITSNISIRTDKKFPKSKKIFIRIFDLGYFMIDEKSEIAENFKISDSEWMFEIDVPEKFYNRQSISLKLKDEIPELEIQKAVLTETGLVLNIKAKQYVNIEKDILSITDSNGNIYQELSNSVTKEDDDEYICKIIFDIGKKDLEKKLFINYIVNDQKYISELIK